MDRRNPFISHRSLLGDHRCLDIPSLVARRVRSSGAARRARSYRTPRVYPIVPPIEGGVPAERWVDSNFHMARASGWNNLANETNVSNPREPAGLEIAGSGRAPRQPKGGGGGGVGDRYGFLRDTPSSISESVPRAWRRVARDAREADEDRRGAKRRGFAVTSGKFFSNDLGSK